jgi:tetratricopeptide (TPR) repeat protein/predicted Ser/Thr protein kinase
MGTTEDEREGPDADADSFAETQMGAAGSARATDASAGAFERGASIGRYIVLEELGKGGMGVVYAAYDPELDRKVAVKLLHVEQGGHTNATAGRSRLLREAQAMARLSHPNVISVHDVGTSDDRVFVAMEFIEGSTLSEWIEEESRDWARTISPFLAAGDGLAAAHRAGLVHRDFKPDNVMVGRNGRVCVLDFGLARPVARRTAPEPDGREPLSAALTGSNPSIDVRLTVTGAVMGTPAYMAPEQHLGRESDARTDQFSFCVALWEALYGERPFRGDTLPVLAFQVTQGEISEPKDSSRAPRFVRRALERGMQRSPEDRFGTMEELLSELRRNPMEKRRRRIVAVVAIAAAGLVAWAFQTSAEDPAAICRERDALEGIWDDGTRAQVRQSFLATGQSAAEETFARVDARVESWAADWQGHRAEACEATHLHRTQSEGALALRLSCLDHQLASLEGLSEAWREADDAVLLKATRAVEGLPDPGQCDDIQKLERAVTPPEDPETAKAVSEIRRSLERAHGLHRAGKAATSGDLMGEIEAAARAQDYPPLLAEVLVMKARSQLELSKPREALVAIDEALWIAESTGHDQAAADAWLMELLIRVMGTSELEAAERAARRAAAARLRIGDPPRSRVRYMNAFGQVLRHQERYDEASATYDAALELIEAEGLESRLEADVRNNYATMIKSQGNYDEAERHLLRAKEIWSENYGPRHPSVGRALVNLANTCSGQGRHQDAIDNLELSLEIFREAYGNEHHHVAAALNGLGLMSMTNNDHARAKQYYLEARPVLEATVGPDHLHMVNVLNNLGITCTKLGEFDEALEYHRESMALRRKIKGDQSIEISYAHDNFAATYKAMGDLGSARREFEASIAQTKSIDADPSNLVWPLTGLGNISLLEGDPEAALALLEESKKLGEAAELSATDMADTDFALARALRATGGDRDRAMALARNSREASVAAGPFKASQVAEIDAWLAEGR